MSVTTKPPVIDLVLAGERFFKLGRTASYAAAERGELVPGVPVLRVGGRKLVVPTAAIERVLGVDVADYLFDELAVDD